MSKHKKIFAKGYTPNLSEESLVVKEVKDTAPSTYFFNNLSGDKIVGAFYEKELQKPNPQWFRIEKNIEWKGNKLHVEWKGNSLV